jgi:hypothetical protein
MHIRAVVSQFINANSNNPLVLQGVILAIGRHLAGPRINASTPIADVMSIVKEFTEAVDADITLADSELRAQARLIANLEEELTIVDGEANQLRADLLLLQDEFNAEVLDNERLRTQLSLTNARFPQPRQEAA